MEWKNGTSLNTELKQTQQLSIEQQQSLKILQVAREELSQLLLDISQENPFMIVEDTREMINIDSLGLNDTLIQDKVSEVDTYDNNLANPDNQQTVIHHLEDQSRFSFRTYLIDQIMCYRRTRLRDLMVRLVDELDEHGFLSKSDDELQIILECETIELIDAITLVQQLEPMGIGSRNLKELWMIQTEHDKFAPEVAYIILEKYFSQLINREYQTIANELNISVQKIQEAVNYYQTLVSKPVDYFSSEETLYIEPDVFIQQGKSGYEITYNFQNLPNLRFNESYFDELKQIDDDELQAFLKNKKQQVQAVLHSLKRREVTLIKITKKIIESQKLFFTSKGHQISPLTIKEIAELTEFSSSTVSRAIQGKHFYTDFGTFELRKLFTTSGIQEKSGKVVIQDTILEIIHDLIEQEDKLRPLSDQKITDNLKEKGFDISRRTINKYRKQLGILPASKRKIK